MPVVKNVAVIGAGVMGAGVAQVAVQAGCRVCLIDVTAERVKAGIDGVAKRFDRSVEKGRMTSAERDALMGALETRTDIVALPEVDLAIEAVVEELSVKHKVFAALEQATRPDAILATNTSSLRVADIAKAVRNPSRVVGMHFFNPAPLMPLVEVISTTETSESAAAVVFDAAQAWGKTPVKAKDTPGFIVNRVARGFYLEALRMLEEGVADVPTIDAAMKNLGAFKMGPFELMDLVGLDVNFAVSCSVYEQSGKPARLKPHPIQGRLVELGQLGRKTKRGFYRYDVEPPQVVSDIPGAGESANGLTPVAIEAACAFAAEAALCDSELPETATSKEKYVFSRILAAIMNEAVLTLHDGVATASDIDTAMKLGTNYPRGPLAWFEQTGEGVVGAMLTALNAECDDDRFASPK